MTSLETILAALQLVLLAPLAVLGLHRGWMIVLQLRARRAPLPVVEARADLPCVTVQLPLYNEPKVADRLIRAVAAMDWPRERLEIQVLDDSADATTGIVQQTIAALPAGLQIVHLRRQDRHGYKAGALEAGLRQARGALIAVFDADFVPPPDFLRRTVAAFDDPQVGMVQVRWSHLNEPYSLLTRMQALLLDGHFVMEHVARSSHGCFFNFNGTAGVFRRTCIEDAGGWQHDTLTEDMDLSYRAQLRGWRFLFRPELSCPAELPIGMNDFLIQQHRWAKGSIQTARKLMGRIWLSGIPRLAKVESVFHLLGNVAFVLLLGLILVALPLQIVRLAAGTHLPPWLMAIERLPLVLSTLCVMLYYGMAEQRLGHWSWRLLPRLPLVLALGAGMCVNNTAAVFSALRRGTGEFRRTPKHDILGTRRAPALTHGSNRGWLPAIELGLGLWATATALVAALSAQTGTALFHGIFAVGLLWVAMQSLAPRAPRLLHPAQAAHTG